MNKRKRVIVTGGAGFIGSHLVDQLVKNNFEVLVLDNLSSGNFKNINKKASFKKIDVCDYDALIKIVPNFRPEYIYHLAGLPSKGCRKVNTLGTKNVIKAFISSNSKKLIFTSSVAVYGNTPKNIPVKEDSKPNPINMYGKTKLEAENEIIRKFKPAEKLYYSILRLSNVYGPRQRDAENGGVIPIFCSKIKNNKPVPIHGDGKQRRDFIYISDVISALYKSSMLKNSNVLNISNGKNINLLDLIKTMEKVTKKRANFNFIHQRKNEIYTSSVNSTLAQKKLNWKPKVDLSNGIKSTIKYV